MKALVGTFNQEKALGLFCDYETSNFAEVIVSISSLNPSGAGRLMLPHLHPPAAPPSQPPPAHS